MSFGFRSWFVDSRPKIVVASTIVHDENGVTCHGRKTAVEHTCFFAHSLTESCRFYPKHDSSGIGRLLDARFSCDNWETEKPYFVREASCQKETAVWNNANWFRERARGTDIYILYCFFSNDRIHTTVQRCCLRYSLFWMLSSTSVNFSSRVFEAHFNGSLLSVRNKAWSNQN